MSQLGSGYPTSGVPRNSGGAPASTGITESLIAPGVTPLPPVSTDANEAQQVLAALGLTSQAASNIGNIADKMRYGIERDNAKVVRQYEMQAARDARADLPQLLQDIADEKILVPEGMKVSDFARQYVEEKLAGLPDDVPEEVRETYRNTVIPQMSAALVGQQTAIQERARQELLQTTADAAMTATTRGGVEAAFQQAGEIDPRLTDTQRHSMTSLQALQSAAKRGDQQAFDAAAAFIGPDRFKAEVQQQRMVLDEQIRHRQQQIQTEMVRQTNDVVSGLLNREAPEYEAALEVIDKSNVPDAVKLRMRDDVESRIRTEMSRLDQAARQQEKADMKAQASAYVAYVVDNPEASGGAAMLPEKKVLPGLYDEYEFNLKQMANEHAQVRFDEMAHSGGDPQQVLAQQVLYGSRNGTTYDVYSQVMEAGAVGTLTDLNATVEGGEASISPNMITGYEMYKRIGAMNPRWRDAHIKSEDASDLYFYAEQAERYIVPGDQRKALFMSARAMNMRRTGQGAQAAIAADDLRKSQTTGMWWWKDTAVNASEMGGKINTLSNFLLRSGLAPDADTAIKSAIERVDGTHRMINGYMIYTGSQTVPVTLDNLAVDPGFQILYP